MANRNQNGGAVIAQARRAGESVFSKGIHATSFSESYNFGDEAKKILNDHFPFSDKKGRMTFSEDVIHPHAYAAWLRKHADNAIMRGAAAGQVVCDVGGHAVRSAHSKRWLTIGGVQQEVSWDHPLSQHSLLPQIVDDEARDQVRHISWHQKLSAAGIKAIDQPFANSCQGRAGPGGLSCECVIPNTQTLYVNQTLKSIDSAYYDDVAEAIFKQQRISKRVAYFAFHDYSKAIRSGNLEFSTVDDEAKVKLYKKDGFWFVDSQVNGNPHVYRHRVINVEDTWFVQGVTNHQYSYQNCCQVIWRMPASKYHDYVIVESTPIDIYRTPESRTHASWFLREEDTLEEVSQPIKVSKWRKWFNSMCNRMKEQGEAPTIKKSDDTKVSFSFISYQSGEPEVRGYFDISYEELYIAYELMTGRTDVSASDRAYKALVKHRQSVGDLFDYGQMSDVVCLATYLVARFSVARYNMFHHERVVVDAREARKGEYKDISYVQDDRVWKDTTSWLQQCFMLFISSLTIFKPLVQYLLPFIILFLKNVIRSIIPVTLLYYVITFLMSLAVRSAPTGSQYAQDELDFMTALFGYIGFTAVYTGLQTYNHVKTKNRQWLPTSCVTIPERLELGKPIFDPKWKFRDPEWDIRHCKTGLEALQYLGCDKASCIGAGQIGFMVTGTKLRTPTIKHACKCTQMAAAIRTTTNTLMPDDAVFEHWKRTSFRKLKRKFMKALKKEGGILVDLNEWKKKYDGKYQQLVSDTLNNQDYGITKDDGYDMFPKIELNYTTVDPAWKDTEENTIKERAIQAPNMKRRVAANAFVNELERIAHLHIPEYCGRCNWEEICAKVDKYNVFKRIWGASDGSGFDMTQTLPFQKAWLEFMEEILDSGLVQFDTETSRDLIRDAFLSALTLKVNVGRGAVQYETFGRASGDGWTTFANTMLMISYWMYVFECAEIEDYFLLVKGDDVLFNVDDAMKARVTNSIDTCMSKTNLRGKHGLGQIVKKVDWGTIHDVDFLSNYFFETPTGLRMTRIPDRVLQTNPWSTKLLPAMRNHGKIAAQLFYSKGLSLMAWGGDLPIWGVLANKMCELGYAGTHTDYNEYADAPRTWSRQGNDYAAYLSWLDLKFGISVDDVDAIEQAILNIKDLSEILVLPVLDRFQDC